MYFAHLLHLAADVTGCSTCSALTLQPDGHITARCTPTLSYRLTGHGLTPQQRLWFRLFQRENQVPLMLWQTMRHNLAGMVYAETINGHLQALEEARHCRTTRVTGGLQLTWLYALATHCGRRRFALQRVRLERHALTLGIGTAGVSRRYELPLSGTASDLDSEAQRYHRLFLRDNRAWLHAWQNGDAADRLDHVEDDGHAC